MSTIFVSIASFRDPDCRNTINNLLEMANRPDRVNIGVCNQIIESEDKDCILEASSSGNIRIDQVDASASQGACWARSRVQRLWRDEDYYFQIDSHMRFVQDWDNLLIGMLNECPSAKAVLSTYPLSFTPPDIYAEPRLIRLVPRWFDDYGILTCCSRVSDVNAAPTIPQKNYFIAAGMLFSRSNIIQEVPYDPNLYHVGEEISLALRLWTNGWDIYTPNKIIAYHDYGKRNLRSKHWENNKDWRQLDARAKHRVRTILGLDKTHYSPTHPDLIPYSLGVIRTLPEYEQAAGINFRLRMIGNRISVTPDVDARSEFQKKERKAKTEKIRQGLYTPDNISLLSGDAIEKKLCPWLLQISVEHTISSVCNIGRQYESSIFSFQNAIDVYTGHDIWGSQATTHANNKSNHLLISIDDILAINGPQHDLTILLQVINYLPLDLCILTLDNIAKHSGKYILLTYHPDTENRWVKYGEYFEFNPMKQPFNWPAPLDRIPLSENIWAGLWETAQIPRMASLGEQR